MSFTKVGVGQLNAPFGHNGEGLLPQPNRTEQIPPLLRQEKVDICTLNEFAQAAQNIWSGAPAKHPGYPLYHAPYNPGGRNAGNAIAVNIKFKVLDNSWIALNYYKGTLFMPVLLIQDPATSATWFQIGIHIPTRRDTVTRPWVRGQMNVQIEAYARNLHKKYGLEGFVNGDRNDGHIGNWADWKVGEHHSADWIFGTPGIKFSEGRTITRNVTGRISDRHSLLRVTAEVPVTAQAAAVKTLPRP